MMLLYRAKTTAKHFIMTSKFSYVIMPLKISNERKRKLVILNLEGHYCQIIVCIRIHRPT